MNGYGSYSLETEQSANDSDEFRLPRTREDSTHESFFEVPSKTTPRRIRTPLVVGIALWVMVMLFELSPILMLISTSGIETNSTDSDATGDVDTNDDDLAHFLSRSSVYMGVYNTRPCSFEECISSPCRNAASTPFVCLGLAHDQRIPGGCGRTPYHPETCSDQCNAIGCGPLLEHHRQQQQKNKRTTTRRETNIDCDVACPRLWCSKDRLCGDDRLPYQCTSGRARYGCSANKFEWTLRSTDAECSSCCKTTSCHDGIDEDDENPI